MAPGTAQRAKTASALQQVVHNTPSAGHLGVAKTYYRLATIYNIGRGCTMTLKNTSPLAYNPKYIKQSEQPHKA